MSGQHLSLAGLAISRCGSSAAKMIYAGSLPFLLTAWQMTGAEAGLIQSLFNLAYAISLLVTSWLSDHLGAKRVFVFSLWLSAAAFLMLALFARDPAGALLLFPLLGATLGGSYTPALMLVADGVEPAHRGTAVGWILAGSSLGYFLAIAAMALLIPSHGIVAAWIAACSAPLAGAAAGTWATRRLPNRIHRRALPAAPASTFRQALSTRQSILLTTGYTAHCWELLGMWAWTPAFLTFALSRSTDLSPLAIGLLAAAAVHLSGTLSTLLSGAASDRWGRRRLLVLMAAAGTAMSFGFGWSEPLGPLALLLVAALYGFAVIGDSGVLSTAMTESVPPSQLGSMLALRSILGFGAGAISPLAFGLVYDLTSAASGEPVWGWAFAVLGAGGALATLSALMLPKRQQDAAFH